MPVNLKIVDSFSSGAEAPCLRAPLAGPQFDAELSAKLVDLSIEFDSIAACLQSHLGHRDELLRWQGGQVLGRMQMQLSDLMEAEVPASFSDDQRPSWIDRADERLLGRTIPILNWLQERCVDIERVRTVWAFVALWISIGFGIAVLASSYGLALILLSARVAGSSMLGNNAFPAERIRRRSGIPSGSPLNVVNRCIGAHVHDAIVLCSVALALSTSARPIWSVLVVVALVAALLAGIYRSAAWQAGAWLRRTAIERWFRIGSIYLGLGAVVLFSSAGVPIEGVPVLALCGLGYFVYAVVETLRTHVAMTRARERGTIVSMRHRSYDGEEAIRIVA